MVRRRTEREAGTLLPIDHSFRSFRTERKGPAFAARGDKAVRFAPGGLVRLGGGWMRARHAASGEVGSFQPPRGSQWRPRGPHQWPVLESRAVPHAAGEDAEKSPVTRSVAGRWTDAGCLQRQRSGFSDWSANRQSLHSRGVISRRPRLVRALRCLLTMPVVSEAREPVWCPRRRAVSSRCRSRAPSARSPPGTSRG